MGESQKSVFDVAKYILKKQGVFKDKAMKEKGID